MTGRIKFQPIIIRRAFLLYAGAIVFFLAYGLSKGGEFLVALWEVRGFFYLFLIAVLVPQVIRTESQIRIIVWVLIACIAFRAAETINLYWSANWVITDGWGNHEDPGYIATMFIFTIALVTIGGDTKQRNTLLALFIPFVLAFIASDRRTIYAVLGVSLILFFLMLHKEMQRKVFGVGWKLMIVFVVYLIVFWDSSSTIGSPARSIRDSIAPAETSADAYGSSMYRHVEDYNLAIMAATNPILGKGYGTLLDFYMSIPITFSLGFWMPHNQILGVIVKTGIVGFTIFVFFYIAAFSRFAIGFRETTNPYYRSVLVLAMAMFVDQLVYSFFDIQLVYYRNNVFQGTMLGLATTIIHSIPPTTKKVASKIPAAEETIFTKPRSRYAQQ